MSTVYFTIGINMVSGELTWRALAKIQLQNHSYGRIWNGRGAEFLRDRKLTIYRCVLFLRAPLCGSPIMISLSSVHPSDGLTGHATSLAHVQSIFSFPFNMFNSLICRLLLHLQSAFE